MEVVQRGTRSETGSAIVQLQVHQPAPKSSIDFHLPTSYNTVTCSIKMLSGCTLRGTHLVPKKGHILLKAVKSITFAPMLMPVSYIAVEREQQNNHAISIYICI